MEDKKEEIKKTEQVGKEDNLVRNYIFGIIAIVIFIIFINRSSSPSPTPKPILNFSEMSQTDRYRMNEIITGVLQDTVQITSTIKNELNNIFLKYNVTDKEIRDFAIYGPAFLMNYQRLFFTDALQAVSTGYPVKSSERFMLEKEALSRGLITSARIDSNDNEMNLIASGKPVMSSDGTQIVFTTDNIRNSLNNINSISMKLESLFSQDSNIMASPILTKLEIYEKGCDTLNKTLFVQGLASTATIDESSLIVKSGESVAIHGTFSNTGGIIVKIWEGRLSFASISADALKYKTISSDSSDHGGSLRYCPMGSASGRYFVSPFFTDPYSHETLSDSPYDRLPVGEYTVGVYGGSYPIYNPGFNGEYTPAKLLTTGILKVISR